MTLHTTGLDRLVHAVFLCLFIEHILYYIKQNSTEPSHIKTLYNADFKQLSLFSYLFYIVHKIIHTVIHPYGE